MDEGAWWTTVCGVAKNRAGLSNSHTHTHTHTHTHIHIHTYTCGSAGKESTCNVGGSIPGLGRSSGEGKGYPLQYSGLENSMDCIVHGVTES